MLETNCIFTRNEAISVLDEFPDVIHFFSRKTVLQLATGKKKNSQVPQQTIKTNDFNNKKKTHLIPL